MSRDENSPPLASPSELIIVGRPEAELRALGNRVEAKSSFEVAHLNRILRFPEFKLRPLFGVSEERLKYRALALKNAGIDAPDLSIFYRLYAPEDRLEEAAFEFRRTSATEAAYIKPGVVPAIWFTDLKPVSTTLPTRPDFTKNQRYLNAASSGGIDAEFAWTHKGGSGEGVRIIDVEAAWRFSHEELRENQGSVIGGIPPDDQLLRSHGTAVIGVVSGDTRSGGITGMCPKAEVRGVSIFTHTDEGWGSAAAIRLAASNLSKGDILLIEVQRPGPARRFDNGTQFGSIPVEWWPDDFKAIVDATIGGVVVVSAAANGKQDLDSPIYHTPPKSPYGPFTSDWKNPLNRSADSNSILVGAGAPPEDHGRTTRPDRHRLPFSNFGSAVDAQGWGELVTTCGFGNKIDGGGSDEDCWYTDEFSGTSSAASIIAGALACIQGIRKARGFEPLTSLEARSLLRSTGAPQLPFSTDLKRIGSRPDLRQIIAEIPPNP